MIGLLGGTFDPVHYGHLRPALEVAELCDLAEVRFIPSASPPHRWKPQVPAEHRLKMVKLAIQGTDEFVVDDREYHRDGPSYAVDTLRSLRTQFGDSESLALLMGQDAFQSFTDWREWQTILTLCHLIVTTRPGYRNEDSLADWLSPRLAENARQLHHQAAGKVLFQAVTRLEISATQIRQLLQQGRNCRYLLPDAVYDHIRTHHLYT